MDRHVIIPETGLRPGQVYSPGIRWEKLVFCSGQTGAHPVTREFSPDIREQTSMALDRLKSVAEAGGASLETIVKMTIFMTDILGEFEAMNEVFKQYFTGNPPSRSTVGVASLARPGLKIEIEAIAIATD
jgi:2-iminobutanoate/2-iminopropanoate deaminase